MIGDNQTWEVREKVVPRTFPGFELEQISE